MLKISARTLHVLVAAGCFALIAGALVLQHGYGYNPCPLCVFQRIAFIVVGLLSLGAALLAPRRIAPWLGAAAALSSLIGASIAGWHLRLLAQPKALSCGPGLYDMLDSFPLTHVLPRVFAGSGDCAVAGEPFFGFSLAGWAFIWFLLFALATIAALARR